jgi:hypothetical protein
MELTLRKAAALSKSLLEAARRLPMPRTVEISIYDMEAIDERVGVALDTLNANLNDALALTAASFTLREAIGTVNTQSGVHALLTERARLDAQERLLAAVVDAPANHEYDSAVEPEIADAKLTALRFRAENAGAASYGVTEELRVRVSDPEVIQSTKDALVDIRRRKTQIADDLLVVNTSTRIAVPADVEELLTRFKLV